MINIAVVEDEPEMQNEIHDKLMTFFQSKGLDFMISFYGDSKSFLSAFNQQFSLVFMDINLPDLNGMETSKRLREMDTKVTLIFITSLAQYAIEGYKVHAFDFIVKPINYYNLAMTLNRALPAISSHDFSIQVKRADRSIEVVNFDDLCYVEVVNHSIFFHLKDREIKCTGTMEYYEKELSKASFVPCNRNYLVNLKYVTSITQNEARIGKDKLLISRKKKKSFIDALNMYICKGIIK